MELFKCHLLFFSAAFVLTHGDKESSVNIPMSRTSTNSERSVHVRTSRIVRPHQQPYHSQTVERLVTCVRTCIAWEGCVSIVFENSSQKCDFYFEALDAQSKEDADILMAILKKKESLSLGKLKSSSQSKAPTTTTSSQSREDKRGISSTRVSSPVTKKTVVHSQLTKTSPKAFVNRSQNPSTSKSSTAPTKYITDFEPTTIQTTFSSSTKTKSGSSNEISETDTTLTYTTAGIKMTLVKTPNTWSKADATCADTNRMLVIVNSPERQQAVEKILDTSGLDVIAIGLRMEFFKWKHSNGEAVKYDNWAPDEPVILGMFAGVSKPKGYKWVTLTSKADGYICQSDAAR